MAKGGFIEGFVYLQRVRQHRTKKGDLMAFAVGVDETAQIDLVVMPSIYARSTAFLNKGQYVYLSLIHILAAFEMNIVMPLGQLVGGVLHLHDWPRQLCRYKQRDHNG